MPSFPVPVFAAVVLAFAAIRLWRGTARLNALATLLGLCAIQSLIIALVQHYGVGGLRWVQPLVAFLIPPAAWMAFQTTAVRRARPGDAVHFAGPLIAIAALILWPPAIDLILPASFLFYGGMLLRQSLRGPDAQPSALLANGNVPAQIWSIIAAALIASAFSDAFIIAAQISGNGFLQPWIISFFSVGNLLVIGAVSVSAALQPGEEVAGDDATPAPPPDADVWAQITEFMAARKPYLDPDLTLARLSRKMGIPAKVISTTINRATGENVSRFVNTARITAAQEAMLAGESVTGAMLGSGFNTKSNFNREFLRVAGHSPREWLQRQQPGQD